MLSISVHELRIKGVFGIVFGFKLGGIVLVLFHDHSHFLHELNIELLNGKLLFFRGKLKSVDLKLHFSEPELKFMYLFLQKFVFFLQRLDFLFFSLPVVLWINVLLVQVVGLALVPIFSRVWFLWFYFIGWWVLCVILLVSVLGLPWSFIRLLLGIFHFTLETRMKGLGQRSAWWNVILFNLHFCFNVRGICGYVIRLHLSNTVEPGVFFLKIKLIVLLHFIFSGWFYLSPFEFFITLNYYTRYLSIRYFTLTWWFESLSLPHLFMAWFPMMTKW